MDDVKGRHEGSAQVLGRLLSQRRGRGIRPVMRRTGKTIRRTGRAIRKRDVISAILQVKSKRK